MKWRQLAAIQIGGAVCLPVIMVGQMLAERFGFCAALSAIIAGNLLLALLGIGMALMSVRHRDNTIDNARRYLSERGTLCFGLGFIAVKFGWFALQLELMSIGVAKLLGLESHWMVNLTLGAGISGVVLLGIKQIGRLADVCLPLLLGTMACALYLAGRGPLAGDVDFSPAALSVVMATAMAPLFNLPTFFRHATSARDAVRAILVLFLLAVPFIEGLGVYLALRNPGADILTTLTHVGMPLWNAWVILFLVLAGVTTNNNNLYSSEVALRVLFPRCGRRSAILLLGGLGTLASLLPLLQNFALVLNILGVGIGGIGAAILISFITHRRRGVGFCSLCGGAVGLATTLGLFSMTGAPLLDAVAVSALAQVVVGGAVKARRAATERCEQGQWLDDRARSS